MYWGLFCAQHGVWLEDKDGKILHYDSYALMAAHWNQMRIKAQHCSTMRLHLYEVTEVGAEEFEGRPTQPAAVLCPEPVNQFREICESH